MAAERTGAEFTAGQFDSAWYHVVTRDLANGSFETQKLSIVHDLQDAYITSSAVTRTDIGDTHPTFDADIVSAGDSTSKIRLRITDGDGSTHIEKLRLIRGKRNRMRPNCICGNRYKSQGNGQPLRCLKCGSNHENIWTFDIIESEWKEPPASHRRHLSKPLTRRGKSEG